MHTFGKNGVKWEIVVFLLFFFFLKSYEWVHLGREFECALNFIKKIYIYGLVNKEKIRRENKKNFVSRVLVPKGVQLHIRRSNTGLLSGLLLCENGCVVFLVVDVKALLILCPSRKWVYVYI